MSGREQFMNREEGKNVLILSPLTGRAVPLEEVPDPVFSQKIIGDGMAVIPTEGKILSPADAQIVSVADTGHAYGLKTEEGVELLIHVGLETVSLKGECFKIHVKPGDTVKAGDLLAEVDLEFLEERKINPITPVLICGGMEGRVLVKSQPGQVEAGKSVLLTETTKENLKDEQKHRQIRPITWKIQHQSQNQKRKSCPLTLTFYRNWEKY